MIAMAVNLDGDGALQGLRVTEADAVEVLVLDGGTDSGRPSVTLHLVLKGGVGETAKQERHIIAQTSARLFCTAARMIMAKYPDLFED